VQKYCTKYKGTLHTKLDDRLANALKFRQLESKQLSGTRPFPTFLVVVMVANAVIFKNGSDGAIIVVLKSSRQIASTKHWYSQLAGSMGTLMKMTLPLLPPIHTVE
jgi:hypothetical protein